VERGEVVSDETSPIQAYVAGGGDFSNAATSDLLMEAERGYHQRVSSERTGERRSSRDHDEWEKRFRHDEEQLGRFLEHCRLAEPKDYSRWLKGYLRRGGKVTHPRNREIRCAKFYVLESLPDHVPSLYGALSINVIVPSGLRFFPDHLPRTFHGQCGHSSFFFMDGFQAVSMSIESFADAHGGIREGVR
jgi:hypothetical protein